MRRVLLTPPQLSYLAEAAFLPDDLRERLPSRDGAEHDRASFEVDTDAAESFRSELTMRLAQVGFGPDYKPTPEGSMLEDLIDAFGGQGGDRD